MFRKICSNRDSRDTLYSELRKEFSGYFRKADDWFNNLCLAYPKAVYAGMVLLIIVSIGLSLTLFRPKPVVPVLLKAERKVAQPLPGGFGEVLGKAAAIQKSLAIKATVESLIAKDSLNRADSLVLEKSIDWLHQLSIQN